MAKVLYTILFQIGPKRDVKVTVPSLRGFHFRAPTFKAALYRSPKAIESFLRALAKAGKSVPREPKLFRLDTMLVEVNAPRVKEASLSARSSPSASS